MTQTDLTARLATLRPEVIGFAVMMETVLVQNDWKGGWQDMEYDEILERIDQELAELKEAFTPLKTRFWATSEQENAKKEAIDVANFCMMLVDSL
jgi:hypothetical protein